MAKRKATNNSSRTGSSGRQKSKPGTVNSAGNSGNVAEFDITKAKNFLLNEGNTALKGHVEEFGFLRLPKGSEEAKQCLDIKAILEDYSKRSAPPRPLSFAVFGPPGSGKSFGVKELAKSIGGDSFSGEPVVVNLSQLESPNQLADALFDIVLGSGTAIPLIFFDEFDAELANNELGWLKWFLAPMQDGVFFNKGKSYSIKRAVFVFAGGTAERYQDFRDRHARYFANRKGPDFISRLRGYLNVEGLNKNGSERPLRRALALQFQVGERAANLRNPNGTLKIDEDVLSSLLRGGHYIHGARSLEALLDMSTLSKAETFQAEHLPLDALRKLHVSSGPMDGYVVGLSAGHENESGEFSTKLASAIVERGAVLSYGGSLAFGGTLKAVVNVAKEFKQNQADKRRRR